MRYRFRTANFEPMKRDYCTSTSGIYTCTDYSGKDFSNLNVLNDEIQLVLSRFTFYCNEAVGEKLAYMLRRLDAALTC